MARFARLAIGGAAVAVVVLVMASTGATAQGVPVSWAAAPPAPSTRPAATVPVTLIATVDDGWHLYSLAQGPGGPIATRITVGTAPTFTLADSVQGPVPKRVFDGNFGMVVETYEGRAAFVVPIRVGARARAGVDTAAVRVRYETCNDSQCLPAHTETLLVPITVRAATAP